MEIDIIAFAPHPDDAEMACGGLLLKTKDLGYSTAIVDLTRGELSTNGDLKTRKKETDKASKILDLDLRKNLGIDDGDIVNSVKNRKKVIDCIRKYRPKMVLTPFSRDRHPDHENAHKLLKDAIFLSGLKKLKTEYVSFRPGLVLSYMLSYQFEPTFVVDISDYHEKKIKAVKAYSSQIYNGQDKKDNTFISTKYFFDFLLNRDKHFGLKAFTSYAEPYFIETLIKLDDPIKFFDYLIK